MFLIFNEFQGVSNQVSYTSLYFIFFPFCFGISEVITYSSATFSKILVNFHMVSNLVLFSPLMFNNRRGSTQGKVQIFSIVFQYILGNVPGVLFCFSFMFGMQLLLN